MLLLMALKSGRYLIWISFIQALRLALVKRDRRFILMFFKCENDCSLAYVEPNMVNTAVHTLCSAWYVTGSAFQVLIINWSAGWSFFISVHLCLIVSSACYRASISKCSFSDLNFFTHSSETFKSATPNSKFLMEALVI